MNQVMLAVCRQALEEARGRLIEDRHRRWHPGSGDPQP
jgi:hypothetical protein